MVTDLSESPWRTGNSTWRIVDCVVIRLACLVRRVDARRLRLAYRNQAGAESCAVWQRGPLGARFIKLKAPIPPEILNQCRVLKKRWEQLSPFSLASANLVTETERQPTASELRATISGEAVSV